VPDRRLGWESIDVRGTSVYERWFPVPHGTNSHVSIGFDGRLTFCERAFLRFLLHHDCLEARSKIILDQVPIFRDNPDNMAYTVFDYMRVRVEVLTLPVAVAISVSGQTIRVDPDLWFDRMLRAVASDERIGLHVMLLRDGEEAKLWVLPLRTNRSFTRDSVARLGSFEDVTAGFIEAAENLEILNRGYCGNSLGQICVAFLVSIICAQQSPEL
jgi:hypothetical protein